MKRSGYAALVLSAALIGLPFLGIALGLLNPSGLIAAPPLDWNRISVSALRSLGLAAAVGIGSLTLGAWFAWIEVRWRFFGSGSLTRLAVLPLVLPSFLIASTIRLSLAPEGALGSVLGLRGRFEGFAASALVLTLCCTPYVQLVVAAALRRLPGQQEEAAALLGADRPRIVWAVILPGLRPALAFGLLLAALYALTDFGAVAVLNANVLTFELYQAALRMGIEAPVLGLVLVACVLPLIAVSRSIAGAAGGTAAQRSTAAIQPSRWARAIAYLSLGVYIFGALLIPAGSALVWASRGAAAAPLVQAAWTTVVIGTLAGAAATLLAVVPASWSAGRRRSGWMEYGVFLASGLPGVLIAFGLLQVILRLPTGLGRAIEGAGVFLLGGLALRFVSFAYAALKPAFIAESQRPIEAAQTLGASTARIWHQLRLPELAPAWTAAFLLAFIAVVKELPITLMLLPAGNSTLATRIFAAHEDAHLADLGAAALVLIALVLSAQAMQKRWGRL
jgi:iron(III) transport system permease protein